MASNKDFEARLRAFFEQHKRSKLRFVPRIVEQFSDHEEEVMLHLHRKYRVPLPGEEKEIPKGEIHAAQRTMEPESGAEDTTFASGETEEHENIAAAKQKKKKSRKVILAAIIVILLAGAGFFFKDKIMESTPGTTEASVIDNESPAAEEAPREPAAEPVEEDQESQPDTLSVSDSEGQTESTEGEAGEEEVTEDPEEKMAEAEGDSVTK